MPTMSVFGTGAFVALDVPTELPHAPKKVNTLLAEYVRLREQRQQTSNDLVAARNRVHEATRADVAALADALRTDAPDPGRTHAEGLAAEIDTLERREQAYAEALTRVEADLRAAVEEAGETWVARLNAELEQTAAELRTAVDAYAALLHRRQALRAARGFARSRGTDFRLTPNSLHGLLDDRIAGAQLVDRLTADADELPD